MLNEISIPAFCTQCRSRCGCKAIVKDNKLTKIEPDPHHPTGEKLCPKGTAAAELVYHPDRLTSPLKRISPKGNSNPKWEKITWEIAFKEITRRMGNIRDLYGPEQVAFSVTTPSGTHISDGISWIERFIRAYGSPNTIYSTEICNWHKDFASRLTYGTDIGTPDFVNTDCIILWGNNPAATWLARSVEIQKALKRGAKLMVVDPRPTLYARRANCWLRVKPGTDQALALGLAHLLLKSSKFNEEFVKTWTNACFLVRDDNGLFLREYDLKEGGDPNIMLAQSSKNGALIRYNTEEGKWIDSPENADLFRSTKIKTRFGYLSCSSALQKFLQVAREYTPQKVFDITGVSKANLEEAAKLIAGSDSVAYYAWNGVGQSTNATQTDRAISILYGLTGFYGGKGGNIPGGAVQFNDIAGHDLLSDSQRAKALGIDKRPIGPGKLGWVTARDAYKAILHEEPYPIRMLFSFGGNLLSAQPDSKLATKSFETLDFHVHADFFMNRSAEYADIILPVSTSWEREGLRTGFDGSLEGLRRVQLRPAVIERVGQSLSDTDIVLELSRRLGLSKSMFDCDADKGHRYILNKSGINLDDLKKKPEGVHLKETVPYNTYITEGFKTPTKRLEIYSEKMLRHGYEPVPSLNSSDISRKESLKFPLRLSGAKTIAYCHSQGRNIKSLRRLTPDPVVELSRSVAKKRRIEDNDWVEIETKSGFFLARAKISDLLADDSVFGQHGWTDYKVSAPFKALGKTDNLNFNSVITTEKSDPISGSIPLRCSRCEVKKLNY